MRSKHWDLGHPNIKVAWRRKETSKESEKKLLICLEKNTVSLKPREDNGPKRMDEPQAADKSKMKVKISPLDVAVITDDLPRAILKHEAKRPSWRRFKTMRKRSMKRQ